MSKEIKKRISIIGTGFIARGLTYSLLTDERLEVAKVLTRRNPENIRDLPIKPSQITNSSQEIIDNSDLVIECSGDPIHATEVLGQVMDAGIPVVTMDAELQVTSGTWLTKKGLITEAEGDQPGSIAALYKDVVGMGFQPIVLGNIKGFLNHTPTEEEMTYWANRSGISIQQVTSFTDGTKIQIEQTLVANGLNATIARKGLLGVESHDYQDGAKDLAKYADNNNVKISDYVLSPKSPAGVFIAARYHQEQAPFLRYYKLGEGPYYVLTRPFHVCHLEVLKTVRNVLNSGEILINNGNDPQISVGTVAKRRLFPGEIIHRGIGSFSVRGEALKIQDNPDHLPIGLAFDMVVKRYVDPGQTMTFDDVEIPESQALLAWKDTIRK